MKFLITGIQSFIKRVLLRRKKRIPPLTLESYLESSLVGGDCEIFPLIEEKHDK
jgi:hypothetical protein